MMKKRMVCVCLVVSVLASLVLASPVALARTQRDNKQQYRRDYNSRRDDKQQHHRNYREPEKKTIRIRFSGKDIDRLIIIGGIYFLSKAISEAGERARERKVVYVSPPPPRYVYVPAPQPTYTPIASATVTVRNSTGWYLVVNINGRQLNLYPGYEQSVSWIYTGQGQYVEVRAYYDAYHQQPAGTYQGNLVGYQIPWILNFDYGSFN